MKLHFEPDLDYQLAAIEAVCDLFRGQEACRTEFTVSHGGSLHMAGNRLEELGVGNRLLLADEVLLANLRAVQLRNGLPPSDTLASGDFTVEMETGTGKTYVYLRTLFELHKRYGFTKFVIVVPSVAIKEGVYKSLQIMADHFRGLYANTPFDYFLYDSGKLGQVRHFATSPHIQIMVVTVGAINKKEVNNLYKETEKTNDERPIDLIRATCPIVIVDEPQSVDGGLEGQGKKALDEMHPLCTLRYSATHVDKHHMLYRLNPVDAYERKLVKQIEVASLEVQGGHNTPYIRFVETGNKRGIVARVELDCQQGDRVRRMVKSVKAGDDLERISGRSIHAGCLVQNIGCKAGEEFLELANLERPLRLGEAVGDVDPDILKRQMIRRTIEEHLDKELRLLPQEIKVLSLFFIDAVEHYRAGPDVASKKGKYAVMFEEEYRRAIAKPKYHTLFQEVDIRTLPEEVHKGYFSIDKKERWADTAENNQANRDNAERAYNLIMKEKERLLSFETPLKFIFSHSALREGWDNPNVFQICVLRDMGTEMKRRQTIGRGLRLCVNQQGERLRGFDVNTLTVIASESYEQFAKTLQKEIEEETGIRFGMVEPHAFVTIPVAGTAGQIAPMGIEASTRLWHHLVETGHLDGRGTIQDSLRTAIQTGTLHLPEPFAASLPQVRELLGKLAGKLAIKNADERISIKTRQTILHGEAFRALWNRIKHKTTYRVAFDNARLLDDCTRAIQEAPPVIPARMRFRKADLTIGKGGVAAVETAQAAPVGIDEPPFELPDLLTVLQDQTQLTRKSIVQILTSSGRLEDFRRNPQQFLELASESIQRAKRLALVNGIRYQRIGADHYFAQELFEQEELTGYIKEMLRDTHKSVYEHVVYDSSVERSFAEQLETNEAIRVYAKLPGWFKVPTPLGSYNPDWAILVDKDGDERLYFVVETKGGLFQDDLRHQERARMACGKAHFQALATDDNPAVYHVATSVDDLMAHVIASGTTISSPGTK